MCQSVSLDFVKSSIAVTEVVPGFYETGAGGGDGAEAVSKLVQEQLFILLCVRDYTVMIMQHAHMQIVPINHRLFR